MMQSASVPRLGGPDAIIPDKEAVPGSQRGSHPGERLVAPDADAAACRYWSCARAAAELRMLRPGPRPGIPDVLICTYECTWCRDRAVNVLHGVCPSCGGELVRRPIRPARLLAVDPSRPSELFGQDALRHLSADPPIGEQEPSRSASSPSGTGPCGRTSYRRYFGDIPNPAFLDQCCASRRGCPALAADLTLAARPPHAWPRGQTQISDRASGGVDLANAVANNEPGRASR